MNRRYEYKYVFQEKFLNYIKTYLKLSELNFSKQYDNRQVNSLYYDNFDRDLYNCNLFGLLRRKKYRLRWYGNIYGKHNSFFEIKNKDNDKGFKKIFKINKLDINRNTQFSFIHKKINEKLDLIERKNFSFFDKPIIMIKYLREYFINWNKNVRITIDNDIVGYELINRKELNLKIQRKLLNQSILEIKFEESAIKDVELFLENFLILKTKNSKYVNFCDMLHK